MTDLIDVQALSEQRGNPKLVLLDVRFTPGKSDGKDRYLAGHIPGAQYLDLPSQLADPHLQGYGSNPLPTEDQLQLTIQQLGIDFDSEIVIYDDTNLAPSARAWWVLRWAGLTRVKVLDGGLAAWKRAGEPLTFDEVSPSVASDVVISVGSLPQLAIEEVLGAPSQGALLDLRPAVNFSFNSEGKGGHIPGAISFPGSELLDTQGYLLDADAIHARLESAGVDTHRPIAAYCGSGVAASLLIFAAHITGLHATIYPGSWSHWSSDPNRPVEG